MEWGGWMIDHLCIDVLFAQAVRLWGLTIWCWHSDMELLIERMRVPMARGHYLEELQVYPFPSAQFHPWTYVGALPPAIALESRVNAPPCPDQRSVSSTSPTSYDLHDPLVGDILDISWTMPVTQESAPPSRKGPTPQ